MGNLERNRNVFGSADLVVSVLRDFVGRVLAMGFSQFESCSVLEAKLSWSLGRNLLRSKDSLLLGLRLRVILYKLFQL